MAIDWKKPLEFYSTLDATWYDCELITSNYCPDDPKLNDHYVAVLVRGWWGDASATDAIFTYTHDGVYQGDSENYIGTLRNKIVVPEGYTLMPDGTIEAEYDWTECSMPEKHYDMIDGFGAF